MLDVSFKNGAINEFSRFLRKGLGLSTSFLRVLGGRELTQHGDSDEQTA